MDTVATGLIIEDEEHIITFLLLRFRSENYQIHVARTLQEGITLARSEAPDFVILDLGLPDGDGMEFIKNIKQDLTIPIIVLSARTSEYDKVAALDAGADDYVTKPFGPNELMARIRTVLRNRSSNLTEAEFGELKIDFANRTIFVDDQEVKFTKTEYAIFSYLAQNSGKLLTYEDIINHTWQWIDSESIKKLQVNMANIRRKIGEIPGERTWIKNELGVGYRMM